MVVDLNFLRHRMEFGEPRFAMRQAFPLTGAFLAISAYDFGEYVDTVSTALAEGPEHFGTLPNPRCDHGNKASMVARMVDLARKLVGHKTHDGGPLPT